MWMRNYIKLPLEQAIVKEHTHKKFKIVQIYTFCRDILQ